MMMFRIRTGMPLSWLCFPRRNLRHYRVILDFLELAKEGRFPRAKLQRPRKKERVSSSTSNSLKLHPSRQSKLTPEVTLVPAGSSAFAFPAGKNLLRRKDIDLLRRTGCPSAGLPQDTAFCQ